jgi:predicted ArsR family transcriptional regulator
MCKNCENMKASVFQYKIVNRQLTKELQKLRHAQLEKHEGAQKILELITEVPEGVRYTTFMQLGFTQNTIAYNLRKLQKDGLIVRVAGPAVTRKQGRPTAIYRKVTA